MFYGYTDNQRAIKDRRYKLIEFALPGQRHTQLFDLEQDPWELNNLADDPSHQERLRELRTALVDFARDWDDFDSHWGKTFWNQIEYVE
jgi:arylsulfatase A-like enzyme